jgi:hypothetical protein
LIGEACFVQWAREAVVHTTMCAKVWDRQVGGCEESIASRSSRSVHGRTQAMPHS